MTFAEWFHVLWRIAHYLNHQWAIAFESEKAPFPSEAPQSDEEVRALCENIEEWVRAHSQPGPMGWGTCSPPLVWSGRSVEYHHTSGSGRLRVYGWCPPHPDIMRGVYVYVQRPFPWQPIVAEIFFGACTAVSDAARLSVSYYPPVAARHVRLVEGIVKDALCIAGEIPQAERVFSDEELVCEDIVGLVKYYRAGIGAVAKAALVLAEEAERTSVLG